MAEALEKLNNEELTEEKVVPETLDRSKRELAIAEAASGQRSLLYLRALVTLAQAQGSSPREVGARMVVAPDGGFTGTIGGGVSLRIR